MGREMFFEDIIIQKAMEFAGAKIFLSSGCFSQTLDGDGTGLRAGWFSNLSDYYYDFLQHLELKPEPIPTFWQRVKGLFQ